MLKKGHVAVDVLVASLPQKRRAALDLVLALFLFLGCVILIWKGWEMAWHSILIRETASTLFESPLYTIKTMVPVASVLLLLQGISKFMKDILILTTEGEE